MDEHIDSIGVNSFATVMIEELEKHKADKKGLRNADPDFVWNLVLDEIDARLQILRDSNPAEMEKQCVHMANYLFLLWMKLREVNHE